jgi:hypothetical protein
VSRSRRTVIMVVLLQLIIPIIVSTLAVRFININVAAAKSSASKIYSHLLGLLNIPIVPLVSIMMALLYMKLRQLGGEQVKDTLERLEPDELPRSRWQRRMRQRLSLHTHSSKH